MAQQSSAFSAEDEDPSGAPPLAEAISSGLDENDLLSDVALGLNLSGYTLGKVVHVTSLDDNVNSYDLAELVVDEEIQAIVMVNDLDDSFSFGAIVRANPGMGLSDQEDVAERLAENGMVGPASFVWAPSSLAQPPFVPYVAATDSATGETAYLTGSGKTATLDVRPHVQEP